MSTQKLVDGIPYWEMVHGDVQPDTPIIIALHYMSGDAHSLEAMFSGYDKPLRVITMQGVYPFKAGEVEGFSWYPDDRAFYQRSEAEQAPDIRATAEPIVQVIRHLKAAYPARIALTGMSQGGDLTLSIATHYPELIDLALPIAGRISEPMRPAQIRGDHLPRIVMLHGVDDPIVPIAGAREEIKWLQNAGFTAELKEYAGVEHDIAKDMIGDIQNLLRQL